MAIRRSLQQTPVEITVTVPTAGSPVTALGSELLVTSITVFPLPSNTGDIYIAFSSAAAASGTAAAVLGTTDTYSINADLDRNMQQYFDLDSLYFDAAVNGEGVVIQYFIAKGND